MVDTKLKQIPSEFKEVAENFSKDGFVTIATVRAPLCFATSATTGAAPVPVPPPIPAAIKTRSEPSNACCNSSLDSSAAF